MCRVLDIKRQVYYKYRSRIESDYGDYLIIKKIFEAGGEIYGYRRLKRQILLECGWIINHKKLLRIMNKYNLRVRYQKIYKQNYRRNKQSELIGSNILDRNFKAERENEKWSTDITYLIYKGKKAYLSSILDLCSRKIIAYKISRKNDNKLVIDTLNEAINIAGNVKGIILHSDQGFQYTSIEYRAICEEKGIIISMSNKGTPVDNAPIESFHSCLKRETLYSYKISSIDEYIEVVKSWIMFYNTNRLRI